MDQRWTVAAHTVSVAETHLGPIRALREFVHLGGIGHLDMETFGPIDLRRGSSKSSLGGGPLGADCSDCRSGERAPEPKFTRGAGFNCHEIPPIHPRTPTPRGVRRCHYCAN